MTDAFAQVNALSIASVRDGVHSSGQGTGAIQTLFEKNSLKRLLATDSPVMASNSPFRLIKQHVTNMHNMDETDVALMDDSTSGLFSRHARTYLEFIDCTDTRNKLYSELDQDKPRFRLAEHVSHDSVSASSASRRCHKDDYDYYHDFVDSADSRDRLYSHRCNSHDAPTIKETQEHLPELFARSYTDWAKSPEWWTIQGRLPNSDEVDSINEAYFKETGLCMQTRLHVFEPSSCSHVVETSQKYNLELQPTGLWVDNNDDPLTRVADTRAIVSTKQTKFKYAEDESVELRIDVQHVSEQKNGDSDTWYFGYIEIEDKHKTGAEFFAYKPKYNGNDAEDGPRGFQWEDPTMQQHPTRRTDSVESDVGIARKCHDPTKDCYYVWRSYTHSGTAWLHEKEAEKDSNGLYVLQNASDLGGFSAPQYDTGNFAGTTDVQKRHKSRTYARQEGECIWGRCDHSTAPADGKQGVWVRPGRKFTRNLDLEVKVFMFDGNPTGWHRDLADKLTMTDSMDMKFLWVPKPTRWDQAELAQVSIVPDKLWENRHHKFMYSNTLKLPLSYQKDARVCTYTGLTPSSVSNGKLGSVNEQLPEEHTLYYRKVVDSTQTVGSTVVYYACDNTGNNCREKAYQARDLDCKVTGNDPSNINLYNGESMCPPLVDAMEMYVNGSYKYPELLEPDMINGGWKPKYPLYEYDAVSGNKTALYRITCEASQTCEATKDNMDRKCDTTKFNTKTKQARIKGLTVFDVSQYDYTHDDPLTGMPRQIYHPSGSAAYSRDSVMMQPEACSYQPAGHSGCAHERQWYRLEACFNYDSSPPVYENTVKDSAGNDLLFKLDQHGGAIWCDRSGADALYTVRDPNNTLVSSDLKNLSHVDRARSRRLCDNGDMGTSWDPPGFPSSVAALLTNQVARTVNQTTASFANNLKKYISSDPRGGFGYAENYWRFDLNDNVKEIAADTMCIKAMSNFNTEDNWEEKAADHLDLTVRLTFVDETESIMFPGVYYTATSASSPQDGHHTVAVESIRQVATPENLEQMWQGGIQVGRLQSVVTSSGTLNAESAQTISKAQFVEERNEYQLDDPTKAWLAHNPDGSDFVENIFFTKQNHHTWQDIQTLNTQMTTRNKMFDPVMTYSTLNAERDCGKGNSSDVLCLDHLQWIEQNNYHDQSLGRVQISTYVKKTCQHHDRDGNLNKHSHTASDDWEDCGGCAQFSVSTRRVRRQTDCLCVHR